MTKPECVTLLITPVPLPRVYNFLSGWFSHSKSWRDAKKKNKKAARSLRSSLLSPTLLPRRRTNTSTQHLTGSLSGSGTRPRHTGWRRRGTPASPPSSNAVTFLTLTQGEARRRPPLSPCLVTKYQHVSALRLPQRSISKDALTSRREKKGTNLEF